MAGNSRKRRKEGDDSDEGANTPRRSRSRHRCERSTRHRERSSSSRRRRQRTRSRSLRQSREFCEPAAPLCDQPAARSEPTPAVTTPKTVSETIPTVSNSDLSNIALVFKELIQNMKSDNSGERYPTLNVVPEFDPSKRNQTIQMWISKVNECAIIYSWSERQIVHYALPKLVGLAQKWYQGLPSLLFSWPEWQVKLKLAFPSDENFGQLLTDMLACKARFGEPLEEYFYEKMVLLNRCNITDKNAIDCILFGIEDRSIRTSAEAAQFTEPDKLLVYLRNVRVTRRLDKNNAPQPGMSDNKRPKFNRSNRTDSNSEMRNSTKCYNCGEDGHPYFRCKQPIKRCDKCHKVGHLAENCTGKQNSESNNKTVLRISQEKDNDLKYFKVACINGINVDCFVDFGSQCTMIRESLARKIVNHWSNDNLPVLRGFGDSIVNCLGKCDVTIKVDSAQASLEVYIVPDHLLQVSLLLGQSFTEQEHVLVFKTNERLCISSKETENNKAVIIYNSEAINIKGFTEFSIYSNPKFSGNLLVEPSFCQKPLQNYEIIQSVIKLKDGLGLIVIKGLEPDGFLLEKDTIITRVFPLHDIPNLFVSRIRSNDIPLEESVDIHESDLNACPNLNADHFKQLFELVKLYRDCFAFSVKELGCVTGTEMDIRLNDSTPVVYRPYRMSHSEREVVRTMVQELEEAGIVQQSSSDYASPVLLVKKKTGDYRLCIDFRALNRRTVKEHYPIPRIDDQLENLAGYKYYTSLDLASGYYQVPLSEASKRYTAFITPDGHFEFTRMPFGLVNAPSVFQKTINNILGNARFKKAFAYMDDVIIPSRTIEEGLQRLRETLDLFKSAGLTLKLPKCYFLMKSINYLGFEVSERGIRPGKTKIDAVEQFPRPTDQHKVRQFIGLASFFRRFIRGFSSIAKPLTHLLKKNVAWRWCEAEEQAFASLKAELIKRPILSFYEPTHETQLHTDASKMGIAGILLQRPDKESPFTAVSFYSRQTSPEEEKFSSYDLETLAVVASLQRFRVYLLGISFTIVTDCNSLRAAFQKRDVLPRVARWWSVMQEYDFNIVYKPGTSMAHVDALSRNPAVVEDVLNVRSIDVSWVSTVQLNDLELQRIVNILSDKDNDNIIEIKNNFVVKRGLLYRKTPDGDRWVVPKGVRWQILRANHDEVGHFGFEKTFELIKNHYWFAKMRRFIKKYVGSCLECAHAKVPAGKRAGTLHPIEKVDRPFHTIHIDHLGPFVQSRKKNSYLLVIIDAFTKFIVLVPVKNTKSIISIKAIKNYFHLFGVPKRLVSDRGTSFTSKKFKDYLDSLGIKHVKNAVATPRANGQVERYNRTILSALTAANHDKPENIWDECVTEIQWGLNNTLNKGTGKTPVQALFGVSLTGTSQSLLQSQVEIDVERGSSEELNSIRQEITEHVQIDQQKQKKRFDKKRKVVKYNVGELVRVEREIQSSGKSRKLVPKLRGPYRITEVLDNDRYRIQDTPLSKKGNKSFSGIFSVDKIHPWLVFNRDEEGKSDSETSESENL